MTWLRAAGAPDLMKGLRMREVYGLLMLWSKVPSAPIRRCQKETDCWRTPLLLETLVCTQKFEGSPC